MPLLELMPTAIALKVLDELIRAYLPASATPGDAPPSSPRKRVPAPAGSLRHRRACRPGAGAPQLECLSSRRRTGTQFE